jgi:putative selenate reductase molybdopterin-binding subunit
MKGIDITLNGRSVSIDTEPDRSLLDILREAGCSSVKFSDEHGQGGADLILLDGHPASAVTLRARDADGRSIETLEGLRDRSDMRRLMDIFLREGAVQCGYCTPGMLIALEGLRRRHPKPSAEEIEKAMAPVLCRCTGYVKTLRAARVFFELEEPRVAEVSKEHRVLGHDTLRVDGRALVEGRPVFAEDRAFDNLAHLKILKSPLPHAHIREIDTVKARALKGVIDVITWKDVPRRAYTSAGQGYPEPSPYDTFILDKKVRHVGDRVAMVIAESATIAEHACELIEVEYEALPFVIDEREAAEGKVLLHDGPRPEDPKAHELFWPADRSKNLAAETELEIGDFQKGLDACEHVFEREYRSHQVQAASIEPHVVTSWLDADGRLNIESATQVPFHVRRVVGRLLDMPVSQIRARKPRIGGGFGGKQEILGEELCALATQRSGRPVRLRYTREEELIAARGRHPQRVRFRAGLDEDHKIQALEMDILENTGANGAHALTVLSVSAQKGLSLYPAPNLRHKGRAVYSNMVPAGAYRGYGAPQAFWALESFMDEVAGELGADPIELRLSNVVQVGQALEVLEKMGEGREGFATKLMSGAVEEIVQRGREAIGWDVFQPSKPGARIQRGLGMALVMQGSGIPGIDMGSAFLKMNEDGSFNLMVGATDLGTGSDTVLAQIAAEVLEVSVEKIIVRSSDTDLTPFDTGAYASSTTYITGGAVKKAAEELRGKILAWGLEYLGCKEDQAKMAGGVLQGPEASIGYEEIGTKSFYTHQQEQLMASASHLSFDSPPPFAAQFADIDVDTETGLISVRKFVTALDVGTVLNPPMAEGQVEGAVLQGIGFALREEMAYDDQGQPTARDFESHGIFRADEAPPQEVIFVEDPEPTGPFGAKAVAEICINGPAPAIGNALANACGIRLRETPLKPEKVLAALKAKV